MMSVLPPNDVTTLNKTTNHTVISPFIRIHKRWKFLKQKNKATSINEKQTEIETNPITINNKNVSEREIETTNLLKRIYSYRATKNKKKETITQPSLSIVKWSSCESISDEKFGRKFNSLRRSRASLIVPAACSESELCYNSSKAKIPQFQNSGNIYKNNRSQSPVIHANENVLDSSAEPLIEVLNELNSSISKFSEEIAQEVEQIFCNANPTENNILDHNQNNKLRYKKPACHSLSLPNINENRTEGSVTNVNIANNNIENDNLLSYQSSNTMNNNKRSCSTFCVEDENFTESTKYSSVNSLNSRPPIPCCPKPINRRDSVLKTRSTETLQKSVNKNISTECLIKRRLNSSPDESAIRRIEARKSADFSQLGKDEIFDDSISARDYMSTSDLPNLVSNEKLWKKALSCCQLPYSIVEAVWDHTSLNNEELNFHSGDLIHVLFVEDDNWWWGMKGDQKGWFPAVYVRKKLFEDLPGKSISENLNYNDSLQQSKENEKVYGSSKMKLVRSKCVEELLTTEIDYVQLLKNIIEGYLEPVLRDETLFEMGDADTLFGNICELYAFHKKFVKELQNVVNMEQMDVSCVGNVFLKHEQEFQIYSQYCNNQPGSSARLSFLTKDKRYRCFFEKCRLKQNMIRLSLDGFLLSPVQRICKYPLQLKELLKHTHQEHEDYADLQLAQACMQNVASLVNERKRCLENVHNLAIWQCSIVDWRGEAVALRSTEIIHTGTLYKVLDQRMPERVAYLFDHQLIYFRKYSTRRHDLKYCGRIYLDQARTVSLGDNTIEIGGLSISNAWKIWDATKSKWHLFYVNSSEEKTKWMTAFEKEKEYIKNERQKGFNVSRPIREAAIDNAVSRHLNDSKRRRMRRKSTQHLLLDTTVSNTSLALTPSTLNKTENNFRRSTRRQSARWSLGSLFEKYL